MSTSARRVQTELTSLAVIAWALASVIDRVPPPDGWRVYTETGGRGGLVLCYFLDNTRLTLLRVGGWLAESYGPLDAESNALLTILEAEAQRLNLNEETR
jgi:hypothetical protein